MKPLVPVRSDYDRAHSDHSNKKKAIEEFTKKRKRLFCTKFNCLWVEPFACGTGDKHGNDCDCNWVAEKLCELNDAQNLKWGDPGSMVMMTELFNQYLVVRKMDGRAAANTYLRKMVVEGGLRNEQYRIL